MAALLTFTMGHTFLKLIGLLLPGGTDRCISYGYPGRCEEVARNHITTFTSMTSSLPYLDTNATDTRVADNLVK